MSEVYLETKPAKQYLDATIDEYNINDQSEENRTVTISIFKKTYSIVSYNSIDFEPFIFGAQKHNYT